MKLKLSDFTIKSFITSSSVNYDGTLPTCPQPDTAACLTVGCTEIC